MISRQEQWFGTSERLARPGGEPGRGGLYVPRQREPERLARPRGDVVIRPAVLADYSVLVAVMGQENLFRDRRQRQEAGVGQLLVAWAGREPVGCVYLWLEPAEEPEIRERLPGVPLLNHLEVRAEVRNRGIGTTLLGAAERRLVEEGHRWVALGVEIENVDAARLYLRLGYHRWGHPPVACLVEVAGPDGRRSDHVELCEVFVKALESGPPDGSGPTG